LGTDLKSKITTGPVLRSFSYTFPPLDQPG
jgi:hypothetical protein